MHARSKVDSRSFALGLSCLIASGCAAGISNQPHGRGAGEWSVTLPTAPSYSQGLAYGKGGSPLPDTWVSLDDVLQPAVADARSVSPKKKVVRKHVAEPQPTSNAPESQQTPATPVAPAPASTERTELAMAETTPVAADATMLNRYAERQSQSQDQQKFAGGDAIVIGAGTLVVVLLVVLLLVLLL